MNADFPRADPAALAAFDPQSKTCTMNCGPHRDDPRSAAERRFLCPDCYTRQPDDGHTGSPDLDLSPFKGHTPGPWKFNESGHYIEVAEGGIFNSIMSLEHSGYVRRDCNIEAMRVEDEANKALIGAAPTLLAELIAVRAQRDALAEALKKAGSS